MISARVLLAAVLPCWRLHAWRFVLAFVGAWCVRGIVLALVRSSPKSAETWTRSRDLFGLNAWIARRRWIPGVIAFAMGLCGIVWASWLESGETRGALAMASPAAIAVTGSVLVGAFYLERASAARGGRVGVPIAVLMAIAACSWGAAWLLEAGSTVPAGWSVATLGACAFTAIGGVVCAAWPVPERLAGP